MCPLGLAAVLVRVPQAVSLVFRHCSCGTLRTEDSWILKYRLCDWFALLRVALSLQAYAVQGQHAIPQPDVSEGPSVSDPIYLKLRSWGVIPPLYFIPLTIIYPATTACHTSPLTTFTLNTFNICMQFTLTKISFTFFFSHLIFSSHQQFYMGNIYKIPALCSFPPSSESSLCLCLPHLNSSPNFTSWQCSRAPSQLHIATRASRVGGHITPAILVIITTLTVVSLVPLSWDGRLCADWLS